MTYLSKPILAHPDIARRESDAAMSAADERGILNWLEYPEIVWLEAGQVSFETGVTYEESDELVQFHSRVPAPASGFYLMPYCDPGCCEPDGPFPTAESATAYSRERAAIRRQELAAPKAAKPTPNF